jgi:hypothetical protein
VKAGVQQHCERALVPAHWGSVVSGDETLVLP